MHLGYTIQSVYLYRQPVDFRKSINGLSVLVAKELGLDPFAASLYVFTNRHRNKLKILYWDRNGFCLWYKRLEKDRFIWPRLTNQNKICLSAKELEFLLDGYDLFSKKPHEVLNYDCVA